MNRREQIEDFIVRSRYELQLGGMSERAMGATTEQWAERLRFIPDGYLDECYLLAMDTHSTRSPLLAKEIVDQWRVVMTRPGIHKRTTQEKTCPHFCSEAGWIVVNVAGVIQFDFLTSEYLYAKPCPIHRPRTQIKMIAELGPRLHRPTTIDSPDRPTLYSPSVTHSGLSSAGSVAQDNFDFPPDEESAD